MLASPHGDTEDLEASQPLLNPRNLPEFQCLAKIYLRADPNINSEKTGEVIRAGQHFHAQDIVTLTSDKDLVHWDHMPYDEVCFILLGKERGWAISRDIMTEHALVEPYEEHGGCRYYLRKCFTSHAYELVIGSVILLNAVMIGVEIDYNQLLSKLSWKAVNWSFAIIYLIEMALKLTAFGRYFFESHWNIFDLLVTAVTLLGDLIPLLVGVSGGAISAVAPVLRLLRLLRLARLFRELRTLMRSFMGSLSALLWIAVFTVIWFYVSAIICVVFVGQERWLPDGGVEGAKEIREKFRSIPLSMYSLFEVMTLEGWVPVVSPLIHKHPFLVAFFFLFLFITAFFLMNLVTAVVVDRTLQAQEQDEEHRKVSEGDKKEKALLDLKKHLTRRNSGSDSLRRDDFKRWAAEDSFVNELFERLEWETPLNDSACAALDENLTGRISIEKFVRLIGNATRPLDMSAVMKMQLDIAQRMEQQEIILRNLLAQTLQSGTASPMARFSPRLP